MDAFNKKIRRSQILINKCARDLFTGNSLENRSHPLDRSEPSKDSRRYSTPISQNYATASGWRLVHARMHSRCTSSLSFLRGPDSPPLFSPSPIPLATPLPDGEKAADTFYRRSQLRLAHWRSTSGEGGDERGTARLGRLVKNRPAEQMVAYSPTLLLLVAGASPQERFSRREELERMREIGDGREGVEREIEKELGSRDGADYTNEK